MGKSKLFGGGSGKPVNAVKVTEFAGEDIPANCFVQKREGAYNHGAQSDYGNTSSTYFYDSFVWLSDTLGVLITGYTYYYSTTQSRYRGLTFYKMTDTGSSVVGYVTPSSNMSSICILPNANKIILVYNVGSNASKITQCNISVVSYSDEEVTYEEDIVQIKASDIDSSYIRVVDGEYAADCFYVAGINSSYDTNSLFTFKIDSQNNITKVKEEDIGSIWTSSYKISYIKDYEIITFTSNSSSSTGCILDLQTKSSVDVPQNCNYLTWAEYASGHSFIDPNTFVWYISENNNSSIVAIDINTGAVISNACYNTNSGRIVAVFENPYQENQLLAILHYSGSTNGPLRIGVIQIENNVISLVSTIGNIINGGTNVGTANAVCVPIIHKGRFYFPWLYSYSTVYLLEYSIAHVEIQTLNTNYGISLSPIKAYTQGNIYCADTSYPNAAYTTYGIPETLATQIIDDSVDEIKQEVQNG